MGLSSDLVWNYLLVDPQLQTQHKAALQDSGTFWIGTVDKDKADVCSASVYVPAQGLHLLLKTGNTIKSNWKVIHFVALSTMIDTS